MQRKKTVRKTGLGQFVQAVKGIRAFLQPGIDSRHVRHAPAGLGIDLTQPHRPLKGRQHFGSVQSVHFGSGEHRIDM